VRRLAVLDQLPDDSDARGAQELLELGEVVTVRHDADADRALCGSRLVGLHVLRV
jgi:hypothetical protein